MKNLFFAFVVLLCVFVTGLAQTESDEDVVRITTNLVQIDAVVTKNGKMVTDLKAEDFEIFENGRRQQITSFAFISNVPTNVANVAGRTTSSSTVPNTPFDPNSPPTVPAELRRRTVAIVIDDFGISAESMAQMRRQLRTFLDEQVAPNDQVAFILTSKAFRGAQPEFTNDKRKLDQAWEEIVWNKCSRVGVTTMPKIGAGAGTGCSKFVARVEDSYRAIRLTLEAMTKVRGRKSMIVFSDSMPLREDEQLIKAGSDVTVADEARGDSNNYMGSLDRLTETAIRASVVIYAVDAGGLQVTSLTAADEFSGASGQGSIEAYKKLLHRRSALIDARRDAGRIVSQKTGGYLVKDQNNFQLDGILNDQSGYYLIGYRPSSETFDKRFNKIKARVKKSGMTLRTRSGFFGMTEEDAKRLKDTKK
jgi:VWFA-related protein